MRKKEQYAALIDYFERTMPEVKSELHYDNPFQLLCAVMLSAQCTDRRVNMVTPALFEAFPTPEVMAVSSPEVVLEYIKSVSYPNSKAAHLIGMAQMLVRDFAGQVPDNLDDLTKLPGVGRKTANVVQAVIWNKPTFAVDTHIFRVAHRLGLVNDRATTPFAVEKELTKNFPDEKIPTAHHWLLLHGRYTCQARRPKCDDCGIREWCRHWRTTNHIKD